MWFVNILITLGLLGMLVAGNVWLLRREVRYLRKAAEDQDVEGRDRLLRDFLRLGGGG